MATTQISAYAAFDTSTPLRPHSIERRSPGPDDVQIEILFCGVCHSDLHSVNGDWGGDQFPLVPGHEIVGKIEKVGSNVTKWRVGQTVGVGCFVDSCRTCASCKEGVEQYCEKGFTGTYGSIHRTEGTLTQGGYSTKIVVDQNYILNIPENIPPEKAAPLLCAGITTYSPLHHWKVSKGQRIAVIGLGGLGHVGVKIAASMGAHVTVLSTSEKKRAGALKLGAHEFVVTKNPDALKALRRSFDFILNTISASHDYNQYIELLKRDGTMVLVGLPAPQPISAFGLVSGRRSLAGSLIGGIKETQEMLDYCAKHGITADIEMIPMQQINEAYKRLVKGDVNYRFVIDMKSLK